MFRTMCASILGRLFLCVIGVLIKPGTKPVGIPHSATKPTVESNAPAREPLCVERSLGLPVKQRRVSSLNRRAPLSASVGGSSVTFHNLAS
jgi:hypothetical protein